jgi:hypothetical protein
MQEGEYRPPQPNPGEQQQLPAKRGDNEPILPFTQEGQSGYDIPHEEMVATIRHTLAARRAEFDKYGLKFHPVAWIADGLIREAHRNNAFGDPPLVNLADAWVALAYPYAEIDEKGRDYREIFRQQAIKNVKWHALRYVESASTTVTLEPPAVKLLDAMAAAVDIPRNRGEATVDLLENLRRDEPEETARILHVRDELYQTVSVCAISSVIAQGLSRLIRVGSGQLAGFAWVAAALLSLLLAPVLRAKARRRAASRC